MGKSRPDRHRISIFPPEYRFDRKNKKLKKNREKPTKSGSKMVQVVS